MPRGRDQEGPQRETTPDRLRDTKPSSLPSGDYSYVLEIVMQMQLSMGKLMEAVDGLKTKQTEQGKKIDGISHKVYAAVAILTLIGAFIGIFGKSIAEVIVNRLVPSPAVSRPADQPAAIAQPAAAQPTSQKTPK